MVETAMNEGQRTISTLSPDKGGDAPGAPPVITKSQFKQLGQLGVLYLQQGLLSKARLVFEKLVEIDPQSSDAHSALGAVLIRQREDDMALMHLNRAIELDSHEISSYINRGEVRLRLNQIEPALEDLKRALELDPEIKDPATRRARAMLLGIQETLKRASH